jgi:hypothetical protein
MSKHGTFADDLLTLFFSFVPATAFTSFYDKKTRRIKRLKSPETDPDDSVVRSQK